MKPCLACKHTFGLPQMIAAHALSEYGGYYTKLEGYICSACFDFLLSMPVSEPGKLTA
jgi:hypothetical protein